MFCKNPASLRPPPTVAQDGELQRCPPTEWKMYLSLYVSTCKSLKIKIKIQISDIDINMNMTIYTYIYIYTHKVQRRYFDYAFMCFSISGFLYLSRITVSFFSKRNFSHLTFDLSSYFLLLEVLQNVQIY